MQTATVRSHPTGCFRERERIEPLFDCGKRRWLAKLGAAGLGEKQKMKAYERTNYLTENKGGRFHKPTKQLKTNEITFNTNQLIGRQGLNVEIEARSCMGGVRISVLSATKG